MGKNYPLWLIAFIILLIGSLAGWILIYSGGCGSSEQLAPGTTATSTSTTTTSPIVSNEFATIRLMSNVGYVNKIYSAIYSVSTNGSLTMISSIEDSYSSFGINTVVAPSGRFIYSGIFRARPAYNNGPGLNISTCYSFDPATGKIATSEPNMSGIFNELSFDPSGNYAYAISSDYNSTSPYIIKYNVDPTTGKLTSQEAENLVILSGYNTSYTSLTLHPSGKSAYTTNTLMRGYDLTSAIITLSSYTVDPSNASPFTQQSFAQLDGNAVSQIGLDPAGKFLYVATDAPKLYCFKLASDGTPVLQQTKVLSDVIQTFTFLPTSDYFYLLYGSSGKFGTHSKKTEVYTIDSNGILSDQPLQVINDSSTLLFQSFNAIAIEPQGKFFYETNNSASAVAIYSIAGGLLNDPPAEMALGGAPQSISFWQVK